MEPASPKDSSVASSPFSSPNIGGLLKIKIVTWSQETGLPVSARIQVGERCFRLHKKPLISKSGYLKKRLMETSELELPHDFPGGSENFEMIALFMYGSSTLIDPFNVASLRCAAEFLEMTEEYFHGNLCDRSDLYLNQVVLQSWDDTLIVLQKCQTLLPLSEELLIVSRCIESLAFMACMEILDPDNWRGDKPLVTMEAIAGQAWNCENVKDMASKDLWIKDIIALPFGFFKRIIGSLRRQGMKEKYVSPIIVFYANKWILSKKTRQFWEISGEKIGDFDVNNKFMILRGIIDLLPMRENKASRMIPVGFYFALLSRSIEIGLTGDSKEKLQDQIASLLHLAQMEDFLIPKNGVATTSRGSVEYLATMETIFSSHVSLNVDANQAPSARNLMVAELWDNYLSHIASDSTMGHKRFMQLVETVPISWRQSHDQLYKAMNRFLQAHKDISQEEKGAVCKYLNCQKLSQAACIEAVQNELMPLRLIVQALFVQQINTHQAFKECSDSFRFAYCGDLSGSLSSSRCPTSNSKSQNLTDSPYTDAGGIRSKLNLLAQRDDVITTTQRYEFSRKEYESTSFRIQNLEQELMSLKKTLQLKNASTKPESKKSYAMSRSSLGKKNPLGQVTSCIGSVNFASQRKYASRLVKVFRRITFFVSRKSKRKATAAPSLWSKSM